MEDPHWTNYVGMVTGMIGTILGFIGYRTSKGIKSLDLRLELKKTENKFDTEFSSVEKLLEYAKSSHIAVGSALGRSGSGVMKRWEQEYESDKQTLSSLQPKNRYEHKSYDYMSQKTLEKMIAEIHKSTCELEKIKAKYENSVSSDDEERKRIRDAIVTRHGPKN